MSENTYDLKPSKEAYQAVKSDVTPVSAFKELIDNSLDNWRRVLDGLDSVEIEIEYHEGGPDEPDEVVIRDDAGGVEEDDLDILFALGQSNKENINGSIGAYGVGAKKAIVNLGNKATIKSRHLYADKGFGFSIDEDWLTDDDDWTVEKKEYDDIEEGTTEIRISDLNNEWDRYHENLVEELSHTYEYFLRNDRMEELGSVSVVVREYGSEGGISVSEITPPESIDWSFAPVDDLFARRYENIDLNSKGFDAQVTLNVTVGLMREASAAKAGADIFCQNRKVLSGVTDERAGFNGGRGSSRLGKFSGQHRRLRVIIEFETEGDATVLPWDAQKSDIDQYNRVARAAYDWIRRIVQPYYKAAGKYDEVPTTITRAYGRGEDFAVTSGLEEPLDYEGRERVTHKPDDDFPESIQTIDRAAATAPLRIYSLGDLPEEFGPAYREEFSRLLADDEFELPEDESVPGETVPHIEVPDELTAEEAEEVVDSLEVEADDHASRDPPERRVGLPEWKQVVYDRLLAERVGTDVTDLELEELETFEETEESTTEPESTDEETADDSEAEVTNGVSTSDGDTGIEVETSDDSDQTVESDGRSDDGSFPDIDGITDGEDEQQSFGDSDSSSTTRQPYQLGLTEDQWSELTEALNLDEDARPDEVLDRLMETMETIRKLPVS